METVFTRPDYASSALITIDLQQDFLDAGPAAIPGTSAIIPAVAQVLACFRRRARPVVHMVRLYSRDGSNIDLCRRHLAAEETAPVQLHSAGAQLAAELLPANAGLDDTALLTGAPQPLAPNEWALYKPRWGAFFGTGLEEHLRELGVSTLVFTGCNFPNCPRTSIYEASERDFRIVAVTDAISGIYDRGLVELEHIGVTLVTAAELCEERALHARS
jgi:nicotinamidase-related amidase